MKRVILILLIFIWIDGLTKPLHPKGVEGAWPAVPDSALLHRPFGKADQMTFLHPDRIFYPETWFHFVNGNVSRKGITRDLEAIAQSGIQGIQLFHGRMSDDVWPGTEEPIECLTPKWEELVRHTASEAHRLGMRFSLQTCPGWAMSGGPWIKPEQAMRHLAYTRTDVQGGKEANVALPIDAKQDWRDWRDICVLAFPTPQSDTGKFLEVEEVRADDHQQEWERLLKEGKDFVMPPTQPGKPYRFTLKLKNPEKVRSVEFNPIDNFNHDFGVQPDIHVRITADGQVLLDTDFPAGNWMDSEKGMTFALAENSRLSTTYQVEITNLHHMHIRYMHLLSAARGNNWEMEAGWTSRTLLPSPFEAASLSIVTIFLFSTSGRQYGSLSVLIFRPYTFLTFISSTMFAVPISANFFVI